MKLMIASDIHGSAHYAKKLTAAFQAEQPDKLLLMGDLLYHGPRNALPQDYDCMAVAEQLNALKDRIAAVRGNCDAEIDQMVLQFPMMADYALLEVNGCTPPTASSGARTTRRRWRRGPFSSTVISTYLPAVPTRISSISTPVPPPFPRRTA